MSVDEVLTRPERAARQITEIGRAAAPSPLVRLGSSVLALDSDETSVADAIRIRDVLDTLVVSAAWHSSPANVARYWVELDSMAAAMARSIASAFISANWRLHAMLAQVNPSPMSCGIDLGPLEVIRSHTSGIGAAEGHRLDELMTDRYRVHVDLVQAIADRGPRRLHDVIAGHDVLQANDVPSRPAGPAWHGA